LTKDFVAKRSDGVLAVGAGDILSSFVTPDFMDFGQKKRLRNKPLFFVYASK